VPRLPEEDEVSEWDDARADSIIRDWPRSTGAQRKRRLVQALRMARAEGLFEANAVHQLADSKEWDPIAECTRRAEALRDGK
jgi:hypothetical protein